MEIVLIDWVRRVRRLGLEVLMCYKLPQIFLLFYIKLSSFTQVLSIRIVLSGCYRLISYSIFAYSNTYPRGHWMNLTLAVSYKRDSKSI